MSLNDETAAVKVRVNKLAANIIGNVLAVFLCIAAILLARRLPHHSSQVAIRQVTVSLIYLVALAPIHETLHALGLMFFAKARIRDIKFGVMWRALMPFCHCKVPITLYAYRRMALVPLIVMGLGTAIWLLISPNDWVALLTGLTVAACVGDVWMVSKLRSFAAQSLVQDCPSEIGCDVFPPATAGVSAING